MPSRETAENLTFS